MIVEPVTLEGRFIRLVPSETAHAEALVEIASPETFQYFVTGAPSSYDRTGLEDYIQRRVAQSSVRCWTVFERKSDRALGMTSYLDIRPEHRGLEIGMTWYAPSARGTKVNPEAKLLLLEHAFERLDAIRVQLKTDLRNVQSQRAIAKLGAVYEGTLRNHMIFESGYIRNTVMYSITPEEWPSVKQGLLDRLGY